jgi:hypothetical protein
MSTTQELPQETAPAPKRRRWLRRVAYGATLAAMLGAGIGIGAAANTGVSQATYNASQAQVSSLKGQVASLNGQVSSLSGQVSTLQGQVSSDNAAVAAAQSKAATAVSKANAAAQQAYASREAALSQKYATYNAQNAALQKEIGNVNASAISASGVYVVGKDIQSGTWHTNGDNGAGGNACYFALLNDNNGSINSIANNNNFDGPETVSVSGYYALEIDGPCTWVLAP